jgi:hypothetical protein
MTKRSAVRVGESTHQDGAKFRRPSGRSPPPERARGPSITHRSASTPPRFIAESQFRAAWRTSVVRVANVGISGMAVRRSIRSRRSARQGQLSVRGRWLGEPGRQRPTRRDPTRQDTRARRRTGAPGVPPRATGCGGTPAPWPTTPAGGCVCSLCPPSSIAAAANAGGWRSSTSPPVSCATPAAYGCAYPATTPGPTPSSKPSVASADYPPSPEPPRRHQHHAGLQPTQPPWLDRTRVNTTSDPATPAPPPDHTCYLPLSGQTALSG